MCSTKCFSMNIYVYVYIIKLEINLFVSVLSLVLFYFNKLVFVSFNTSLTNNI